MLAKDLLKAGQRGKDILYRLVIGFLAGSEPGFVDAVIHVVVDPAIQLINLPPQFRRVVVARFRAVCVKGGIEHANNIRRFVADDGVVFLIPQHRHGNAPGIVRIGMKIELIEKIVLIELVAGGGRKAIIKGPAALQHQGVNHRYVDKWLKAFQRAQDQRAVRPWAGEGDVEMVAIFLRCKTAFAGRACFAVCG